MDNQDHAILAIYNGHVTGRKAGGPASALALDAIQHNRKDQDLINFSSTLDNGHRIKTSVMSAFDPESGRTFVLIINFDCTGLIFGRDSIENLTKIQLPETHNIFFQSEEDLINTFLSEALAQFNLPPEKLKKQQRVEVVRYIKNKGGFRVQNSAQRVADLLGISRCTVYNYLKLLQDE